MLCVDNFFTGRKDNIAHLLGNPHFEAMRHDVSFPLYVEVDEIYNLACPASPIHYQYDPVQTTKTSVPGAINMLGLAKRLKAKIFQASTSEVYGDPTRPSADARTIAATSTRSARAPATTRASAAPRRCSSTITASTSSRINVARIFNTYGPRMHPNDGRVVSNFIVQALKGEPITIYGDGSQTRAFCYVDDLIEGFVRLMAAPDEVTGPINLGNPVETTVGELAAKIIELTGSRSTHRATGRCRSTIRCSAAPTSPGRATCWAGSRACRSRPACEQHHRLFRPAAERQCGSPAGGKGSDLRRRLVGAATAPLDPAKFRDPLVTAKGERRAAVAFAGLETLWFNTGTLCNITCARCYIESSPRNDRLAYLTAAEVATYLDEIAARRDADRRDRLHRRRAVHEPGLAGDDRDLPRARLSRPGADQRHAPDAAVEAPAARAA